MKKPNLKSLKIDPLETKRVRTSVARQKSVKITINIDSSTLSQLRAMADKSGIPYQRLINRTLSNSLLTKSKSDARLERIEKDIAQLKRKIAA